MGRKDISPYDGTDRRSALLLALLAAVAGVLVVWLGAGRGDANGSLAADSVAVVAADTAAVVTPHAPTAPQARLFAFDPNTADSATLAALGLSRHVVANICRYRERGGTFTRPLDLARIYGLSVGEYERLEPHIRIGRAYRPASVLVDEARAAADTLPRRHKMSPGEHVDANAADTLLFVRVPGIGPYFARQIVSYGQRLGGYVSVGQLMEIDGFPPEAVQYFSIDSVCPHRLNVNSLSLMAMRRHPYMPFRLARAIIDYRRLHGELHSLDEVALAARLTDEQRRRIEPYIEF